MLVKKLSIGDLDLKLVKTSGIFQTNTYIFEYKGKLHIVDPGEGIGNIINEKVIVLLTHGHFDHISGLSELDVETVFVSLEDEKLLKDAEENFSAFFGKTFSYQGNIKNIDDYIETIKVPGHTFGSRIFKIDKFIFTGDTVFCSTIGRSDLGGSKELMEESIKRLNGLFSSLPPESVILPGHDEICTLKDLFKVNPFFKGVHI